MRVISVLLLALLAGAMQGCVPVVAVGIGTGVMMAQDRRTSGSYVEDQAIELKALEKLGSQYKDTVHVGITSFNRSVLITGQVPNETIKRDIGLMVSGIDGVRLVNNEIEVAQATTLSTRANDSLITSNIKLRFVNDKKMTADRVKVVTENGSVFLLGIVTRAEANSATEHARAADGVQRVVKMFEYLD